MCTVTFVPLENSKAIFTSSRDVGYKRKKAIPPQLADDKYIYPTDTQAGGTWFVTSEKYTLCLLNGAFEKHDMKKTFAKSRGLVVLDAIKYHDIQDFFLNYDLTGVEPFTLVIIENGVGLWELKWDEHDKFISKLDHLKPHIWSSSTLYTKDVEVLREQWFNNWLIKNTQSNILQFHKEGGFSTSENDVVMDRGFIGTVSITSLEIDHSNRSFQYYDLRNNEIHLLDHKF